MVVDTSVVLAIFFNEPSAGVCLDIFQKNVGELMMSTVNYTEVLIMLHDRQPRYFERMKERMEFSALQFVPPTAEEAEIAALARRQFPLNLGDCFAYALAKHRNQPLLTLDRDFRRTDLNVLFPRMN